MAARTEVTGILKLNILLRRLWAHIEPSRRRQVRLLAVLMVISSFAEIISIGAVIPFLAILTTPETALRYPVIIYLMEYLLLNSPHQLFLPLTIIFCFAALMSGGLRLGLLLAQTKVGNAIGADLSRDIYRKTLYQPYEYHISNSSSDAISMLTSKVNTLVNQIVLPILTLMSSLVLITAILFTLISIDPKAALIAIFGFGAIYFFVTQVTKRTLLENSLRLSRGSSRVIKILQEGLGGIRDVLIDRSQEAYCLAYQRADLSQRRASAYIQVLAGTPRYVLETLGMVLIALLAFFMSEKNGGIANSIPILGALALGAQRILPLMQAAYSNWITIRGGQASLDDALTLLNRKMPEYFYLPIQSPIKFSRSIDLNGVSYRYSNGSPWILKNLSLSILKGSRIGFIGETGSGKSTLLDVIMGLLLPTHGFIALDGIPITEQNKGAWHRHIAHVPQSIFLTDNTVAENIAFGIPYEAIDFERLQEVSRRALLDGTIESFPAKYRNIVGERGVRLSGGQRQRIGIARALYKRADVIILDEATSALDNETESSVMDGLNGLGSDVTILVVAHRLTTLSKCDLIVEISDGSISRCGSYEELILGH